VLQCFAVCCSVLQCVAVCCSELVHCSVLQCDAASTCMPVCIFACGDERDNV